MIFIFFQGQLYGFITVQQEIPSQRSGMKKLMEKDYIGGNGIKQGLSRNLRVTLLQNDSEKETLTRRKKRISKKPKKRRNVTEQEKPSSNESGTRNAVKNIKIPSKELIAWDPHADTQVYLFDNKEHNDPNISGLENADSIRDAKRKNATYVHQRVDAIKSKTTPPLKVPPCDGSSPETESDPTQENDAMYHWTKEQLLVLLVFCVTMGIIFGCTLGIIFGCSLRPLLLSLKNSNCNYFMLQRRKEFRRHRKNTNLEVDSSK